jgi:hypothetical protein
MFSIYHTKYVIVNKCDKSKHTQSWYDKKIGYGFKVFDRTTTDYIIRLGKGKGYGMIDVRDAEIFTPTRIQKIKILLRIRLLTNFQLDILKYNL